MILPRKLVLDLKPLFVLWGLLLVGGCGQEPEELIEELKSEGWTYVATHGTKGEVQRTGTLHSTKAQAVEAAWVDRGKRKVKLYQQNTHYFMILRFIKEDEDEFVVVMKKRK